MPSWEAMCRVTPADSWGSAGTFGKRGLFLALDSESLSYGAEVVTRDNKIQGLRESPVANFSIDRYNPRGAITWQPKVDELVFFFGALFQFVAGTANGTYIFYPRHTVPNFVVGGSVIGTTVYSLNIDLFFGQSFVTAGGTMANGIRFTNGIVEKLTLTSRYGEDVKCTAEMKFLAGSYYNYPAAFAAPSVYGSFSAFSRLVDYMGTAVITNETYDIENWEGVFTNNTAERSKLGKRGWNRFPFSGKFVADGQFDMELQDDLAVLAEGQYAGLTVDLFAAAGNAVKVAQSNIAYMPFDVPLNGGEEVISITKPYRAYPPAGSTGPSSIVTVYTGTAYGSLFTNMY